MVLLIFLNNVFLLEDLKGKKLAIGFPAHEKNLRVCPFPNDTYEVVVLDAWGFVHKNILFYYNSCIQISS